MSTSILPTIQSEVSRYGYPILMILGNIGNVFTVIIFSEYRRSTCAIYLIILSIINSVYVTFNYYLKVSPVYYGDETIFEFAICKLFAYLQNIIGQIGNTMIILAAIDRLMITSNRATFRAFSTLKRAKWLIIFSIIFWLLFLSFFPIITTIVNGQCGLFGIYGIIYFSYSLAFIGMFPPIILGISGYLTYRNMKQAHNRIQPVINNDINANNTLGRRDRELRTMVISEALVYIFTTTPFALNLIQLYITQNLIPNKSVQYSQIESFLSFTASFLLFINRASAFYIYLIVSKPFRRNFIKLIIKFYQKLTRQQPQPVEIVGRTNEGSRI